MSRRPTIENVEDDGRRREGRLTASGVSNDKFVALHGDRGDGLNRDALLRGRRLSAVGRRGMVGLVWGMGVAVWHVRWVRELVDVGIMALVDMVCVHDMDVSCIARGVAKLGAARGIQWRMGRE